MPENYATYCATGKKKSRQVHRAVGALAGAILALTGAIMRHTGKWFEIGFDLSLEECLDEIENWPHFMP